MGSLTEKVAIGTGASSGIGRAIAERLAQDGVTLVVNWGTKAALEQFTNHAGGGVVM